MTWMIPAPPARAQLRAFLIATSAVPVLVHPAFAEDAATLPKIVVEAPPEAAQTPPGGTLSPDDVAAQRTSTSDTADLLRSLPGIANATGGGFAGLPVMRGLNDQRLNVLVDGAPIAFACPNEMNPPLSYTDPQTVRRVSAVTGVTPVSMGGDSIGGAITVETRQPRFAEDGKRLLTGEASSFYRSNGDGFGSALSVTTATNTVSVTYNGSYTRANNYEGGGDDGVVRSTEYAKTDHGASLSARTDAGLFELSGGYHFSPHEGFPNQYMDMTSNESWVFDGHYNRAFAWGTVDIKAYHRDIDHEMNFLEDKGGTADGGMPMNTQVRTTGYTVKADIPVSDADTLTVGNEFHHQWLNDYWPPVAGSMMMGPDTFININHAHRDRLGTFAEWEARWTDKLTTLIGARNDLVWMNTGDVQPYTTGMMGMEDAMAATAFNAADHQKSDTNWGFSALSTYALDKAVTLELGYAHKTRSPNIYERYAWGRGSMSSRMIGWYGDGNGYVGNLALEPEKADTVSGAVALHGEGKDAWSVKVAPYYTHVDDYIDAVEIASFGGGFSQLQFVNQQAAFYGVDLSGATPRWTSESIGSLRVTATAGWLRGKNLDDGGPLYHQMPLNATVTLEHMLGGFHNAVELALVKEKTRVDATRNEPETGGYALLNLRTGYLWRNIDLTFDVENLFDTAYDLPLGGVSLGDFNATGDLRSVPGSGRSFNVGLSVKF